MAVIDNDTTIGAGLFPFDSFDGITVRSRQELFGTGLDEVSSSVNNADFIIPSQSSYTMGALWSNAQTANSVNPPSDNSPIDFTVEANAFAQITIPQSRSFSAGTIDIQGVLNVIQDVHTVWPSNTGNGTGITSMRLNGVLQATGTCIIHGRALSPTAVVDLNGLTLVGNWGIQFPPSASWVGVSAPDPGSSGNSDSNDRFFRLVRPSLGAVPQQWTIIADGTWSTSSSSVLQIQRASNQFPNETDVLLIGDNSQFPNIDVIRLGSQDGGSAATHNLRRMFAWNPAFTDAANNAVVSDVILNFTGAGSNPVYKATTDSTIRNSTFSNYTPFVNGIDINTDSGFWIQTAINTIAAATTTPSAGVSADQDTTIEVFSKSFSHLSNTTALTTEHNTQDGFATFSETAAFPLTIDSSVNNHVLDVTAVDVLRAPEAIRPATFVTDSDNIYPALKFAWWGDETNNTTLPLTALGNTITFNGRLNINHEADTSVPAGRSIIKTDAFTTNTIDHFRLNSSSSTNGSLDNVDITGNITVTKASTASSGHNLFLTNSTVTGALTLRNEHSTTFQILEIGTGDNMFGSIDVGGNITLNLEINTDVTIDLDAVWGPQTYGTGVTIENDGTGQISLLSTTAAAAGVTAGTNVVFTESITFNNATAVGAIMRIYNAVGFTGTSTPLQTITQAGGAFTFSLPGTGANYLARISAIGFASLTIETGLITAGMDITAPTLTPTPLAVTTGVPSGLVITTPGTQTAGDAGTTIAVTGGNIQIVNGTSTNPLFASAVILQGFGRGVLLNWVDRVTGEWVTPTTQLLSFDIGTDSTTVLDDIQIIPGDNSIQRLQGINDGDNNVFNTTTATTTNGLTIDTVTSIPNTNPNAILIADIVVDEINPIVSQGSADTIAAAQAAQLAAESAEAEIKLVNP